MFFTIYWIAVYAQCIPFTYDTSIPRYATCSKDYHLARQFFQQRSRIYARYGPVSSSSSGSSFTRRGRHGVLSIGSRYFVIRAARNDAENTIPVCERKSLSCGAPYSVSASRPAIARHADLFSHSPHRIVANRAGLCSPNPPISSSNERIISRSAAFSRTFSQPAQFHARLTPSCLLS